MKNLCVIFLLFTVVAAGNASGVVWLHGLQGHEGSNTWDIYQKKYTPQNGYIFRYLSDKSIPEIAKGLYNEKLKSMTTVDPVILVGHSMGGLVARSLQKLSPNVKGLITVGTPHLGAAFLKNTVSGGTFNVFETAVQMANNAINKSTAGLLMATMPVSVVAIPLVLPLNVVKNKLISGSLKSLSNAIVVALSAYKLGYPCVNDLMPGSEYIRSINKTAVEIPFINVYGVEDNWQVVRALGTLSKVNDVKNPANLDKSFDMEYVEGVMSALAMINQVKNAHDIVYNALVYPAAYLPWIWSTREFVLQAKSSWDQLYNYINEGMHNDLLSNMGAIEYRKTTFCTYSMNAPAEKTCYTKYVPFQIENDGILSKNDVLLPATVGREMYNVRLPGVNHQEMGNQIEVRKFFDNALKKGMYGKVFVL